MDSTNAVTSVGTLPAAGALGLVARWRRLRAGVQAGRRQRLIGFGVGRFLALLELIRLRQVRVYQRGMFGPIRVFRPVGPPGGGAPVPPT